jgi:glycerate kinase
MNIIFAADSFKGSLTSREANEILTQAAEAVYGNGEYRTVLIADGGEGTLAAVENGTSGYERRELSVTGPMGEPVKAHYLIRGAEAVIEMAEASGLPLVPAERRNPLHATTRGTGELIRAAVENGARTIYIGIGGSATNDGGIGAMTALGYRFLDSEGKELEGYGKDLARIAAIDDSRKMPELSACTFTVMCDVRNPLTGPNGATRVFGLQKGAEGEIGDQLEEGMVHYQELLSAYAGEDISEIEGLGAAGGLGAALYIFLKAHMKSGIDVLLDLTGFDELLEHADLTVSGEGKTDCQTLNGKVVAGIAKRCKKAGKPLYVVSGCLGEGIEALYDAGVTKMAACVDETADLKDAMAHARENLYRAAVDVFAEACLKN